MVCSSEVCLLRNNHTYHTFNADPDFAVWCSLRFTIEAHSTRRFYKTIAIADDSILNALEERDVELTLGTTDRNVQFDPDASSAVVTVVDNESKLRIIII